MRESTRNNSCFCCGDSNPHGLNLNITYETPGTAFTSLIIPAYFSGWQDLTHGGFLSLLADEMMAHACLSSGQNAVTAELCLRYLKPIAVNTPILVRASVVSRRGKLIETRAEITTESEDRIAHATGKFFIV